MHDVVEHTARAARLAKAAAPALAAADDERLDTALDAIADGLERAGDELIEVSSKEVAAAEATLSPAVIDRLRLDADRVEGMVAQVRESRPCLRRRERPDGSRSTAASSSRSGGSRSV